MDGKILDGKGKSFIFSIKTFPTATKLTAKQQMATISTQELEGQFNAVYGTARIVKRGTFPIDLKRILFFVHAHSI